MQTCVYSLSKLGHCRSPQANCAIGSALKLSGLPENGPASDARLIAALRAAPRSSTVQLAHSAGLTRAAAAERLAKLLDSGEVRVVAGAHPVLTGENALGHVSVTVCDSPRAIAELIADIPSANFISLVSGQPHIVVELRQHDLAALRDDIALIRAMPGVAHVNTSVYTDVLIDALLPPRSHALTHRPDDTDLALIGVLRHDGRATFARLGAEVGLSPAAARQRYLRLIEGNTIRIGVLSDKTSGTRRLSAGFGLNVRGSDRDLLTTLAAEPAVEFLSRSLGQFDVIGTVVADGSRPLQTALDRMSAHSSVMRSVTWLHLALLRESYEDTLRGSAR